MLTCEECGALVDPEATKLHQEWHEKLVTASKSPAPKNGSITNPNRIHISEIVSTYMN